MALSENLPRGAGEAQGQCPRKAAGGTLEWDPGAGYVRGDLSSAFDSATGQLWEFGHRTKFDKDQVPYLSNGNYDPYCSYLMGL